MLTAQEISKEQVTARREALGISKAALAREAGMHPSTICNIENGRLIAYPSQVEKILLAFERLEGEGASDD